MCADVPHYLPYARFICTLIQFSNQEILFEMLKHNGPRSLAFSRHLPAEIQCKAQHILLLNKHTEMPDSNVFYWK